MEEQPILPYLSNANGFSHLHQTYIAPKIALTKDAIRKSTKDRYSNLAFFFDDATTPHQNRIDIPVIDICCPPVHPF